MLRLILCVLLVLCAACSQAERHTTNYRGETPSYALSQDASAPKIAKAEETVYVTKTGTKYHASGCRHLKKSSIPIELSKAKARYGACSVCGS